MIVTEFEDFFYYVCDDLSIPEWKMKWSDTSPCLCVKKVKEIWFDKRYKDRADYIQREIILHEIAHIFVDDPKHDFVFYVKYIFLLKRYILEKLR